jgi:hypothetical protein
MSLSLLSSFLAFFNLLAVFVYDAVLSLLAVFHYIDALMAVNFNMMYSLSLLRFCAFV